jgi:hypothetical protein
MGSNSDSSKNVHICQKHFWGGVPACEGKKKAQRIALQDLIKNPY